MGALSSLFWHLKILTMVRWQSVLAARYGWVCDNVKNFEVSSTHVDRPAKHVADLILGCAR